MFRRKVAVWSVVGHMDISEDLVYVEFVLEI